METVEVVCSCGRVFKGTSHWAPKHFNFRGMTPGGRRVRRMLCYGQKLVVLNAFGVAIYDRGY